jgi:DNA-binding NtrC family response regulator
MQKLSRVPISLVGFGREDLACLNRIFDSLECPLGAAYRWRIRCAASVPAFLKTWGKKRAPIVLCDNDRQPDGWKHLLDRFAEIAQRPMVIVTSQMADEKLWAEALNLGAWDVLSKPFSVEEVSRIAVLACLRSQQRPTPLEPAGVNPAA